MTITISGQPHTVDAAAGAVQEIVAGGNPFGANAPPNFAGGAAPCVLCDVPFHWPFDMQCLVYDSSLASLSHAYLLQ